MTSPCLRFFIYGIGHTHKHTHTHTDLLTLPPASSMHMSLPGEPGASPLFFFRTLPGTPRDLHRMLGVRSGEELLYVGDHIFGDIVTSKR